MRSVHTCQTVKVAVQCSDSIVLTRGAQRAVLAARDKSRT
uniref:Uncharacterized protein n=1 Tax=viral metagenome TaxID=1070528 RepID=A0A6C0AU32_9ZZZZ